MTTLGHHVVLIANKGREIDHRIVNYVVLHKSRKPTLLDSDHIANWFTGS